MGTAYSGRYRVDPNTRTVTIDVVTSLDPSDVGKTLARHYSPDKGRLRLSGRWMYAGETLRFALAFSP
jgi:hypothetical protein